MLRKFFNRKQNEDDHYEETDYDEFYDIEDEYIEDEEDELEGDEFIDENQVNSDESDEFDERDHQDLDDYEETDSNPYYGEEEDYEYEQYLRERKRKIIMLTFFSVAVAVVLVYLGLTRFGGFFKDDTFLGNSELKIARTEEVLGLMYNANGVDDLISVNEKVLSYFQSNLHSSLDIKNEEIYSMRYSQFSNERTSLTVDNIYEISESEVLVIYTISNEFDIPSTRYAKFTYDETGLIIEFKEYRLFPVIE